MKIRMSYVSNSSSSSYIFLWKTDRIQDLYELIRYWDQYFSIHDFDDESRYVRAHDVITALKAVCELGISALLRPANVESLDVYLEILQSRVEYSKDRYNTELENAKRENRDVVEWRLQGFYRHEDRYNQYLRFKELGFCSVLDIQFGNNHGDVFPHSFPTLQEYRKNKDNDLYIDDYDRDFEDVISRQESWRSVYQESWNQFATRIAPLLDEEANCFYLTKPNFIVITEDHH